MDPEIETKIRYLSTLSTRRVVGGYTMSDSCFTSFRILSHFPKWIVGINIRPASIPEKKPPTWAKLSTYGNKPIPRDMMIVTIIFRS
ncbi:hypothetical protein SeLEV6574_g06639 [Synchytrium endobioticum]|uniref:Uncharacterized protein n=1 Tax=Synchytrium endobioticum TaxID=286115 RepID=A0A507CGV0_9FUNG|nr:hypothetical protein SeLEV6574_g06639 [Synchytrium endobioticum]